MLFLLDHNSANVFRRRWIDVKLGPMIGHGLESTNMVSRHVRANRNGKSKMHGQRARHVQI